MNLFKEFQEYVEKERLFEPKHKLLLALSGGVDSMVLLFLLKHFHYNFEVAHVNFQLRANESNGDEQFVSNFCKEHAIPCHIKRFETKNFSIASGMGTQEAARTLRYQWFNEIILNHSFDTLLTAHHANDQAETVLFHLTRGAGSRGLSGIHSKSGNLCRPLLFATKVSLLNFAAENSIPYRTDSSNNTDDYNRNFIRHQVIPKLQHIQPAAIENILHSSKIMEATHFYFQKQLKTLAQQLVQTETKLTKINLALLVEKPFASYILFEWLNPFGFNFTQVESIIYSFLKNKAGAMFYSDAFEALLDRDFLLIAEPKNQPISLTIKELPFEFQNYVFEVAPFDGFKENVFWLDIDKLRFPLQVRSIKEGDKFKPLGMETHQKISDYLINKKINRFQKREAYVLLSNETICALLPYQISTDYKLKEGSKNLLKISIKKAE